MSPGQAEVHFDVIGGIHVAFGTPESNPTSLAMMKGPEGPCLGIELNIWERMKVNKQLYIYGQYAHYMHYLHYVYSREMFPQVRHHIVHTMVGEGGLHEGYATIDYRKIHQGNAGKLGNYPILSVLPDKFARFLFEYHSHRFESLELPQLPADRSDFDVHGALLDD